MYGSNVETAQFPFETMFLSSEGSTCPPNTLVMLTGSELEELTSASDNPFSVGLEEAQLLAPAILACWAAAWVIRQVVRLLRDSGSDETQKEN